MSKRRGDGTVKSGSKCDPVRELNDLMATTQFSKNLTDDKTGELLPTDVILVAANGAELKCHKIALTARSRVFAAMISPNLTMESSKIQMRDYSEKAIQLMITFAYGLRIDLDDKDLTCAVAVELCMLAHKYEMTNIRRTMVMLLGRQSNPDWFDPDAILKMYYIVKDFDTMESFELLVIMTRIEDKIRACETLKKLTPKAELELRREMIRTDCLFH